MLGEMRWRWVVEHWSRVVEEENRWWNGGGRGGLLWRESCMVKTGGSFWVYPLPASSFECSSLVDNHRVRNTCILSLASHHQAWEKSFTHWICPKHRACWNSWCVKVNIGVLRISFSGCASKFLSLWLGLSVCLCTCAICMVTVIQNWRSELSLPEQRWVVQPSCGYSGLLHLARLSVEPLQ